MRTALFWPLTWRIVVIPSRRFGITLPSRVKNARSKGIVRGFLALEAGTDMLSRNVVKELDRVLNVMAHAQKPYFVFPRNGRVHLNRRGRQFSRLLAAEVCASEVVMLDTPGTEVV